MRTIRTFPLTTRALTLSAMVALVSLTVLAVLVAGASAVSAQGTVPEAPDQPIGTAVFAGGVDLEWNDVAGADSYDVQLYRNGQWLDLPGDGVEIAFYGAGAIISGLDPNSTLWFQVRARNAHGFSDWSNFSSMASTNQFRLGRRARPDNVPASGAPVINGTAQVGESLTADTTGIEDGNGLGRVQFRFQWVSHDGSSDTDIASATDSTYTLAASDEGKTIKVRVAFTDRGGYAESLTSAATATVAAATNSPATGAAAAEAEASAPTNLRGEFTTAGVQLNWSAPTDNAAAVTGYEIVRRRPWSGEAQLTTLVADTGSTLTSYLDITATAEDEQYLYRVSALSGGSKSAAARAIRVSYATQEQLRPTGLTLEATADGVRLRWTAPEGASERVEGYAIQRNPTADGQTLMRHYHTVENGNVTYLDQAAVTPDQDYTYRVRAIRGLETGEPSETAYILLESDQAVADLEQAPSGLTLESSSRGVVLRWSAPALDAQSVTEYEILRNPTANGQETMRLLLAVPKNRRAYTDDNAVYDGRRYSYQIRAMRGSVASELTEQASIVHEASVPDPARAPSNLQAEEADDGIHLNWDAPSSDANTVTGHMIERTLDDGSEPRYTSYSRRSTTWNDTTSKQPGQTYRYRVSVSRGGVLSDWSEPVTVGWQIPPSAEARLSTLSASGVTLDPSFDPEDELYRGSQDGVAALTTVTATPIDGTATVSIVPADADSNTAGHQVALKPHGETVISVNVLAEDGEAERRYWIVISPASTEDPQPSSGLNDLQIGGLPEFTFDGQETNYDLSAPADLSEITVVPSRMDPDSEVEVFVARWQGGKLTVDSGDADATEDGHQALLASDGDTLLIVRVTSSDGEFQRVYITRIRKPVDVLSSRSRSLSRSIRSLPRDGSQTTSATHVLSSLSVSDSEISPAFATDTLNYWAIADSDAESVTVSAASDFADAGILIIPPDRDSAVAGHQVLLGETQTEITVIASRGPSNWSVYTVRVSRALASGSEPQGVDFPADPSTPGIVAVGGSVTGKMRELADTPWAGDCLPGAMRGHYYCGFHHPTDNDWYAVTLEGGKAYQVDLQGKSTGNGTLEYPFIYGIYDSDGVYISGTIDNSRGPGEDARVIFTPEADDLGPELYYIAARTNSGGTSYHYSGTYRLSVTELADGYEPLHTDDFPDDITTTGSVEVGGRAQGEIEVNHGGLWDSDWFRMELVAHRLYEIEVRGAKTLQLTYSFPVVDLSMGTLWSGIGSIYDSEGNKVPDSERNEKSRYGDIRRFRPAESGVYYVESASGHLGSFYELEFYGQDSQYGTYTVSLRQVGGIPIAVPDDYAADTSTTGQLTVGGSTVGEVERTGDIGHAVNERDWFAVELLADETYVIDLQGRATAGGSLFDPKIWGVFDADGVLVPGTIVDNGGVQRNSRFNFTPTTAGVYYVSVGTHGISEYVPLEEQSYTGTYTLSVYLLHGDEYPADRSTTGELAVGGSTSGLIGHEGDVDWFRVELSGERIYRFTIESAPGADGLSAPTIGGLRDYVGQRIWLSNSGLAQEPALVEFRPVEDETYYVVLSAAGSETGAYTLSVSDVTDVIPEESFPLIIGTELVHNATIVGEVSADVDGAGLIAVEQSIISDIDGQDDVDWFRVTLEAGVTYQVDMYGSWVGALDHDGMWRPAFTLFDPWLSGVYDADGVLIAGSGDTTSSGDGGDGKNSRFTFTPASDGDYYIEATGVSAWSGTYGLKVLFGTRASVDTGAVSVTANSPATGAPTITGTAQVGEELTADTTGITDADGLDKAVFAYQWLSDDTDIAGETDATYTLVAGDEGKTIKVRVTIIDDAGNETTLTSAATDEVGFAVQQQGASNTPATGEPTITGTARVGETLTANTSGIADADGLENAGFSYQWVANDETTDTDIAGETDATYTLVADDEGQTIKVKVSFADDADNRETLTSAATAVVAAPEPLAKPTGLSAVVVSHDAVTLTWDDPQDDAITGYVILRRDRAIHPTGTFVTIAGDTGSADTTYTDDTVEPDKEYVYRIKAINEHGEVSEKSHWLRADTPAVPVPDKPTGLSAAVSHDTVTLTWDNPQDDTITGYVILRRDRAIHPTGTFVTIAGDTASADTTYTDDTVEPDKEYVYRIKAINEHGKVSEISDWVRGFTPAAPAPAG